MIKVGESDEPITLPKAPESRETVRERRGALINPRVALPEESK